MDLRAEIRDIFHAAGFPLVGFARLDPPRHIENYRAWIDAGLHAGMAYLAEARALERRADPALILPEARTLLVLALPYPPAAVPSASRSTSPRGRIASYAQGADYHELIPPRINAALGALAERLGNPLISLAARAYTDTGPILERDFAQRAGLGWAGKNTCLIVPGKGSYFLLAEVFLALELDADEPFRTDQCGSCTRCIDACPTACIRPDRTLDAGRCISYLTIENKGSIPLELRPALGEWVFGCDICQQVCPWNIRFARPAADPAFQARADLPEPDLIAGLALDGEAFNHKFKGSPLKRAKRRGYLRNLAVALGNSGDPRAVAPLLECLNGEPEPLIRGHAAWALGRLATPQARAGLTHALRQENDPAVRAEIELALQR